MTYGARVLADSVSFREHRLATFEITFPRIVLAEFNTHRVFSRNSASSRAIPVVRQLLRVLEEPYVPDEFGSNQPGMQAGPPLEGLRGQLARQEWVRARDSAAAHALRMITYPGICSEDADAATLIQAMKELADKQPDNSWLNVHKQLANRLLEPFMWHTLIVTATQWSNFFNLRAHPDAQPEMRRVAELMRDAWKHSTPRELADSEWHLPLVCEGDEELSIDQQVKASVGRCARVSYLTHDGRRDPDADIALHDHLLGSGHLSPFEHVARPLASDEWCGNFRGWRAYRNDLPHEADPLAVPEDTVAALA
ncbi:MAG: FAD-dependent thymidylate synthase [Solirubrobacteraceae bacterium]